MEKSKLTFYAAKKFGISRRTIYKWIEVGIELAAIENKMREVGDIVLIEPRKASEILNLSKQTIYRWVKLGKVGYFKLFFNTIRLNREEVDTIKNNGGGK